MQNFYKRKMIWLALGCFFFIYTYMPSSVDSQTVVTNGQITYASIRDGAPHNDPSSWEIYVMNKDGSHQTRLTTNMDFDDSPNWSPDGTKIAFVSDRDGNFEIYVMNADGSNPVRLTDNNANDDSPDWSPDGTQIAFASNRDGNSEIYVMNADGSNPVRLTDNNANDRTPDWSPDGTKIAFVSNRDGNNEIYMMNADGSNPTRLTDNQVSDTAVEWSPLGDKLVYVSSQDAVSNIFTMSTDGSDKSQITAETGEGATSPTWSPDGLQFAYVGICSQYYQIITIKIDGTNRTCLNETTGYSTNALPYWRANIPPTSDAGADRSLTVADGISLNVTLNRTIVSYSWVENGATNSGLNSAPFWLAFGTGCLHAPGSPVSETSDSLRFPPLTAFSDYIGGFVSNCERERCRELSTVYVCSTR